MGEVTLSVIIPVYNTGCYLEKCVKSILAQTCRDIEIILIDNGSEDDGGKICDCFAGRDERVVVYHKTHGNISSARNKGLELAHGKWIGFVDADDWIEPGMYQCMLDRAKAEKAQIAVCGFYKENGSEAKQMKNDASIPSVGFDAEKALEYAFIRDEYRAFCAYVWNKIFDAEIIKNQRFDENIQSCEDVDFFARVAAIAKKVCYIERPFYHHLEREDSSWKIYRYEKRRTVLMAYEKIIRLLEDNKYKKAALYAKRFYAYHASLLMEFVIKNDEKEKYDEVKGYMEKYYIEYCETNTGNTDYIRRYKKLMNYNAWWSKS